MAQFFGIEDIKDLSKASPTTIEWASGSNLRIGGQVYNVTSVLTLDTATDIDTGAIASDTIYYVYAVVVAGTVSLKYSLSDSAPTGYSAYRLIGSFGTDGISEISGTSIKDQGKVGDVIHSMLTEEQFIAENGAGWILADGRDVTGSKYDTLILGGLGGTVPDMRGQFLRGLDTSGTIDPDGAGRILGDSQAHALQSHTHTYTDRQALGAFGSGGDAQLRDQASQTSGPNSANVSTETRPINIAVNIFIKIEDIAV